MLTAAIYTLYRGVGSVDAIDTAMKLGAHHPMGRGACDLMPRYHAWRHCRCSMKGLADSNIGKAR